MDKRVIGTNGRIGGFSLMRVVLYGALSMFLAGGAAFGLQQQNQQQQAQQQQQPVPNAPIPQAPAPHPLPSSLTGLANQVSPGMGTANAEQQAQDNTGQTSPHVSNGTVEAPQEKAPPPDSVQKTPPLMPKPGEAPIPPPPPVEAGQPAQGNVPMLVQHVTVVDVPVIVRDKHGREVAGLPWWRFRVYEDGVQQRIWWFTTDAYPLSVAFVIDNTLPSDIMDKVNRSLQAVPGSLTSQDTVAVIGYAGTSPQLITDFTAANGARLPAALSMARRPGQQMGVPDMGDPMTMGPTVNGQPADPTLTPQIGNSGTFLMLPRESHPLNDAILYAAEQLASQPKGRRRVIYVISDGKNVRSKATFKEVTNYLLTNNIAVYGTQVGDSAVWGIGYLDRTKLPLLQPEDVLPRYAAFTGGIVNSELSENGIQDAFSRITQQVRTAYTIDYISHQSTLSGKYHSIDVRVEGLPGLNVIAKQGYYPAATANY